MGTDGLYADSHRSRRFCVLHDSFSDEKSLFVGKSKPAQQFFREVQNAAMCDLPVLILGESGCGKTFAARKIHKYSRRHSFPFFDANIAAISETVIEPELFGSVKGAFTDAIERDGYFLKADGGSVFLDEIGDAPLDMQKKLLKVVETGEFRKIGSSETLCVNIRLMFATNVNLKEQIKNGNFREDLFYRIAGVVIEAPSLNSMKEDIEDFCNFYLSKKGIQKNLSKSAAEFLSEQDWPGNFRQLKNTIERAAVFCSGEEIRIEHLKII